MDGDDDTCLVIAGDIWTATKYLTDNYPRPGKPWMSLLAERFKYIVFVLGNHDFWNSEFKAEVPRVRKMIEILGLPNVFLLEQSTVVLDQVKFTGGSLWTDFKRHHPEVMMSFAKIMETDHRKINGLTASRAYEIFMNTKKHIFKNAKRDTPDQKVVVVTHMAPSFKSVHDRYRNPYNYPLNYYFFSDMEKRILANGKDIDLWFHGHMHDSFDYTIGHARVVCNPRGYQGYSGNPNFDPYWRVEV